MPLIMNGRVVEDSWTRIDDEAALPTEGAVIVSYDRWEKDKASLLAADLDLGVWLNSDQSPELLDGDIDSLKLVALNFPSFADGRAFTYGRMLRERYEFEGQVRAMGGFILDQIEMLRRCGFDAFETEKPEVVRGVNRNASANVTVYYQPGQDEQDETASSLRRRLLDSHKELGYRNA
ncbi:DUF934 domain-containing protein [Kiloniella sp. b19]|uniref:DUF934 domain-containing protein n=1 Tax=Kiloniella sp. GXU_MW_B19 TaxID=3141326 RepID=UPI0031DA9A4E